MKLQIQADENRKMVNGRFKTFGCGSAIASSSSASKCVKGKTVEEANTIKNTGGGASLVVQWLRIRLPMQGT